MTRPATNSECLGRANELPLDRSDAVKRLAQARQRVELLIIDLAFDLDVDTHPTTRQLNDQEPT